MKYLLDTCVISELVAKQPNPKVIEFVDSLDADDVYLSVITIGEIAKGIEKLTKSKRKQELIDWLQNDLLIRFDGKIIALTTEVMLEWGTLTAQLESAGKIIPAMDSLIATTCHLYSFILITRNVNDFAATGIEIANPWD